MRPRRSGRSRRSGSSNSNYCDPTSLCEGHVYHADGTGDRLLASLDMHR